MNMTGEQRVRFLLSAIPYYRERQYSGNYCDNDDLNDILDAIERAVLTERQRRVIELTFVEDMTQLAAGKVLGMSKQLVKYHEGMALAKITEAYEEGETEWT